MNKYLIQQKIKTIASLCIFKDDSAQPITINGIEFNQWDFNWSEGCKGDAWIAEGKEDAENYHKAVINFRNKLSKVVPKIAFVSQCFMDYSQESFFILKTNNNEEKIAFIHYVSGRGATGLIFDEEEKKNLDNLNLENNEFYWYMNDCYNTTGYTAKLLLMFAALESLAGKVVKIGDEGNEYETYNKENMLEILGGSLFNQIYGRGGMRHKLTHGEYIDKSFSGNNYIEILHKLILKYFNKNFNTKLNTGVINPQRHPFGNAYYSNIFFKPKEGSEIEPSLKSILEDFRKADPIETQSSLNYDFVFGDDLSEKY